MAFLRMRSYLANELDNWPIGRHLSFLFVALICRSYVNRNHLDDCLKILVVAQAYTAGVQQVLHVLPNVCGH